MASKLLHLLHVVAILESCRGGGGHGHGGQMVKTEEEETVVTLLRARGGSMSDVPRPAEVRPAGPGVSSDGPQQGGPAGVSSSSSSSPERRLLSARQSAHHHRDSMLSINMFKVYERYSKEPHISQKDGNTVRSFKAAPHGTSEGRERFRFNLSSIQESEHILSASFHFLYKRPRPPRPWPCRRGGAHSPPCGGEPPQLLLRGGGGGGGASPSGAFAEPLGLNVTLSPPKRGSWQVIDVTALVRRARGAEEPTFAAEFDFGSLLARSQAQQQQQKNKAQHGGHHHHAERPSSSSASLPYVLVFADDRAIDEPNSVAASLQRYGPFPPAAGNGEEERVVRLAANADAPPAPASASASRARRDLLLLHPPPPPRSPAADQIQTNDLPEVHFSSLKNHELWQSTYFPPMKAKVKQHGRGKAGQEGGGGGGGLAAGKPPPPRVLSFDERTMKKARRRQWSEPRVCARRYLRVDFADIGWSEWVLAPKAFDAYYCAGTCGFPIPKVVRPSNHATIQSIVRAVGIVPGVPEPCCVPDKMSPLSVLFLDPERNMVLKVYPGMSVDTCACR